MKPTIQFIFSAGYRCYAVDFLVCHGLRKFSVPFDYLYINLETVFKLIDNKLSDFLSDIVIVNKNQSMCILTNPRNTSHIKDNVFLWANKVVSYMKHDYNHLNLRINQNYLDDSGKDLSSNMYEWDNICSFHHHDLTKHDVFNKIQMRCERFNSTLEEHRGSSALFHITKIVHCDDIRAYMTSIIDMKNKYNFGDSYVIMIICCDNLDDTHYFNEADKCLFMIKRVESYDVQLEKYEVDNMFSYENEYNIMMEYFAMELIEKNT